MTPVEIVMVVSVEDDLRATIPVDPLALVTEGDHLLPAQLTDVAKLQTDFADVFLSHIETYGGPRGGGR